MREGRKSETKNTKSEKGKAQKQRCATNHNAKGCRGPDPEQDSTTSFAKESVAVTRRAIKLIKNNMRNFT